MMGPFRTVLAGVLLVLLAGTTQGCGTQADAALDRPSAGTALEAPASLEAGRAAAWTVRVRGPLPCVLSWDFGGGALPNTGQVQISSYTHVIQATPVASPSGAAAQYTARIDVLGADGVRASRELVYSVVLEPGCGSAGGNQGPGSPVAAQDPQADVDSPAPPSARIDELDEGTTQEGGGIPVFEPGLAADAQPDPPGGEPGGMDFLDSLTGAPGLVLAPDTLYLLVVGNTVVVATGVPASPLWSAKGVAVTVESAVNYVPGSFNVGIPGGERGGIDGIWSDMDPQDGFILAPEAFIQAEDIGGGRHRISFNLTPLGGCALANSAGALFNFKLTGPPGTYKLGFQEFQRVSRTYYSDGSLQEHYWGALMADEYGNLDLPGFSNILVIDG